jgi:predicted GNAT family acetyltransferase/glutaredoxin
MLTLYQAEWCPFSSAVREILTELGLDFVARQVEPWPEQRADLRALAGTDQIPTLQTQDGQFFRGTREIYGYLEGIGAWDHAEAHRRRFVDHREARESDAPGQLVAYFPEKTTAEVSAAPEETEVVDVPDESRYELRIGDRTIGLVAYHRRPGRIAFTHTEIDKGCEGRGFGARLVSAALDDARREALEVIPLCPYVAHFIGRHPEYEELVPESYRDRFVNAMKR